MTQNLLLQTNFAILEQYDIQLLRLSMLAEKYFSDDPNTCLLKMRQFGELMAQQVASRDGEHLAGDIEGITDIYINGDNNLANIRPANQHWTVHLTEESFHRLMFKG